LPWLCRPPWRPPSPATRRARVASLTASVSPSHAAAPDRVARARSERTPRTRLPSRCCGRPESYRLRNCAKVGVLQVRHHACRRPQRGDDRGGVAFTTHPVALRRDGKRQAFRCGRFRPCRPE
jgi:hypothetical protein